MLTGPQIKVLNAPEEKKRFQNFKTATKNYLSLAERESFLLCLRLRLVFLLSEFKPMQILKEIGLLIKKDVLIELRNSYAISSILLYIFSIIFIVYFSFISVDPEVWNALFWIVVLFISVSAVSKSFVQESDRLQLYYYSLAHPISVILAKMIYNVLLLLILVLLAWGAFSWVTDSPVRDYDLFFLALFLGSVGFSVTLTFISAISAKTSNNGTLMAILSFPLLIPIITTLLKLSNHALIQNQNPDLASFEGAVKTLKKIGPELSEASNAKLVFTQSQLAEMTELFIQDVNFSSDILILVGIDILLIGLALVLFPFLWRN